MNKFYDIMMLDLKKGAGIALLSAALFSSTVVNAQLAEEFAVKLQIEDGELINQVDATTLTKANFMTINPDWSSSYEEKDFTPMTGAEGGYARFINNNSKVTLTIEVEEEGDYQMTARYAYGPGEVLFFDDGENAPIKQLGLMGTQVIYADGTSSGEVFKDDSGQILADDGQFPYELVDEGTWKTITWDKYIHFKEGVNKIEIWKFVANPSLDWIVIGDMDYLPLANDDFDMNSFNLYPNPVTNGVVNIDLVDFSAKTFNYSIFTLDGRMVQSNNVKISNNKLSISVSALNKGAYVLKAVAGDKTFSQKLIVQ
ncbi:MAG: T9SS type A sorting domain-containing protein [Bacteroidales bacterium]|nr:T9SS type A sorting domain-containing protein [Bacteroidales bacterium]